MTVVSIVQARMGSSRLPGKVIMPVAGMPMIEILLRRLSRAATIDKIIVATTNQAEDSPLIKLVESIGFDVFVGSEKDVLDRYKKAAVRFDADVVVRITGDCPLVDPLLVDQAVNKFMKLNVDYMSNVCPPSYPDGLDVEVVKASALILANKIASEDFEREHVTPILRAHSSFSKASFSYHKDLSDYRWTVDTRSDLNVIKNIFNYFAPDIYFAWEEVLKLYDRQPELFGDNKDGTRNSGASMSKGQKHWTRAKDIIPGGNMLLSKRAEMFLPEHWPTYYSKSSGCHVWDLDNNKYVDMSLMGVGTNILGYANPEIDNAVKTAIDNGNMSTLNCPEEVYLAEKLINMHPWADMVRFARTGGEANSIAIRIGRAASGKDGIAVCGYHGWHDWYLSANLEEGDNLERHLLPGLSTLGVPKALKGTLFTFNYNDYDELEKLVNNHDIGVIKMEVVRNTPPKDEFLQKVRSLATRKNIVLIFDECTSGFRQTFGGLHLYYGVNPDIAVFGKALGNGFAITAVIGSREVMEVAQETFISSTFWTERAGPVAALATLDVMEKLRSWDVITEAGYKIRAEWDKLAERHNLQVEHSGLPALTSFQFVSEFSIEYKTLLTQEMLKLGYLATTAIYTAINHRSEIITNYIEALDRVFSLINECENGRPVKSMLDGPKCHTGFKRLN